MQETLKHLLELVKKRLQNLEKLPVAKLAAGGIATPADASFL